MKKKQISFNETGLFSKLICDFINSDLKLNSPFQYYNRLNDIKDHIKKQGKKDNTLLVSVLKEQYKNTCFFQADLSLVESNINNLNKDNTYTITTGHQLNIFLGPLFLIYKIVSVISHTYYLNKNIPNCHFVPCFWMATEDHDFDEISDLNLYNKNYTWDLDKLDVVGNLHSESILNVLSDIKDILCDTKNGVELLNIYQHIYTGNKIYADAMRGLLTSFFGNYGLVIVDGNHPKLKQIFIDDFKEEICSHFVYNTVSQHNDSVKGIYKPQINAMKDNIFYLRDTKRRKIYFKENCFSTSDKDFKWSKKDLLNEVSKYPERFSPNVFLRPLYQERIMNNIMYIGGPSEVSYWIQLLVMFKHRKQLFPILVLRSHFVILSKKTRQLQVKLGLSDADLFLDYDKQIKGICNAKSSVNTKQFCQDLNKVLLKFEKDLHAVDNFPTHAFDVFYKRFQNELKRLDSKVLKFNKEKYSNFSNKLLELNKKIFPNNVPHERIMSFIPYYLKYGSCFFDLLIRESSIFDNKYIILKEEE